MSEMPHCAPALQECKMLKRESDLSPRIREFNQFLRIPVSKFKESIGHSLGYTRVRVTPLKTARKMQGKAGGCTIGVGQCIQ